jgi:hypothetical protein
LTVICSAYRSLYILNWIYRYFTEPHYVHWISTTSMFCVVLFCFGFTIFKWYLISVIVNIISLDIRICADIIVCRFLLLLHQQVNSYYALKTFIYSFTKCSCDNVLWTFHNNIHVTNFAVGRTTLSSLYQLDCWIGQSLSFFFVGIVSSRIYYVHDLRSATRVQFICQLGHIA